MGGGRVRAGWGWGLGRWKGKTLLVGVGKVEARTEVSKVSEGREAGTESAQEADCASVLCPAREQAFCLWTISEQWSLRLGKRSPQAPSQIPQTLPLPQSLRSPRMMRWRKDCDPVEVQTLFPNAVNLATMVSYLPTLLSTFPDL